MRFLKTRSFWFVESTGSPKFRVDNKLQTAAEWYALFFWANQHMLRLEKFSSAITKTKKAVPTLKALLKKIQLITARDFLCFTSYVQLRSAAPFRY